MVGQRQNGEKAGEKWADGQTDKQCVKKRTRISKRK